MYQQPTTESRKSNGPHGLCDENPPRRRCGKLVLSLSELPQAAVIERYFQERGWKVHLATDGADARRQVKKIKASVVILSEQAGAHESGWLTCWKLLSESPNTKVIVVGESHVERGSRNAGLVGAAGYVHASDSAAAVYHVVDDCIKTCAV